MFGCFQNEINVDLVAEQLKKYTNEGKDDAKLKALKITKIGYEVYVNKELTPSMNIILHLSRKTNTDILKYFTLVKS